MAANVLCTCVRTVRYNFLFLFEIFKEKKNFLHSSKASKKCNKLTQHSQQSVRDFSQFSAEHYDTN